MAGLALLLACSEGRHTAPRLNTPGHEASGGEPEAMASPSAPASATSGGAPASAAIDPAVGPPTPVYLAIEKVGVVRLEGDGFVPVIASKNRLSAMALAPDGSLWASFFEEGTRRFSGGKDEVVSPRTYRALVARSASDAWAVTQDIEWALEHHDGQRFTSVKTRAQLPGRFTDNHFHDLALGVDDVWLSSWNGLWRLAGSTWQPIAAPPGVPSADAPLRVVAARGTVFALFSVGWFVRDGQGWDKAGFPGDGSLATVAPTGLAAGLTPDSRRLLLGRPPADSRVTSDALQASRILDVAIDGSERAWVATNFALTVLDRAGHVIAAWEPGMLAGVSGAVVRVAVVGAGPASLPVAHPTGQRWEITGRIEFSKSGGPLANALVELCPGPTTRGDCDGAMLVRRGTTSADGSFRLTDVPSGTFALRTVVPRGAPECGGLFSVRPTWTLTTTQDCAALAATGGVCAMGTLRTCLPFEMPPPRR